MTFLRKLIGPAALALAAALPLPAAHAAPLPSTFDFSELGGSQFGADAGAGFIFDPSSGLGGWIGQLVPLPFGERSLFDTLVAFSSKSVPAPGSAVSFFGDFAFVFRDSDGLTPDDDVLFGTLDGLLDVDPFVPNQRLVTATYTVTTGTGLFAGFTGFGSSIFGFDANQPDDGGAFSYGGSGRFTLNVPQGVPEPGTLALVVLAGLGVAWFRGRPMPNPVSARRRPRALA